MIQTLNIILKLYSKILSKAIRAAKKLHYDKLISNSNNKIKATWNIIKTITGKRPPLWSSG
jgi:hypothetical protein